MKKCKSCRHTKNMQSVILLVTKSIEYVRAKNITDGYRCIAFLRSLDAYNDFRERCTYGDQRNRNDIIAYT